MKKLCIILFGVLFWFSMNMTAFAEHKTANGLPCNNTYHFFEEDRVFGSWDSSHLVSTGVCVATHYIYLHRRYCTSCQMLLGYDTFMCTEAHSVCGIYHKNCLGIY